MDYGESKVYFDGSHYIAIPHTTRLCKKRPKPFEETITVVDDEEKDTSFEVENEADDSPPTVEISNDDEVPKETEIADKKPKKARQTTRKQLFDELYSKYLGLRKKERRERIIDEMTGYFKSRELTEDYVDNNLERKQRNLISRRIRMCRKANLQDFNYFCTFTYDDKLHTEESFKKKLKYCFWNMSKRKGWKYMGVWERSPEKKRLHFHGIFYIPPQFVPTDFEERNDYSFNEHKRKVTVQSKYFADNFGRNDFEEINDRSRLGDAMAYLMKYIEKSGEKIVYSKGLPQFFISDILESDIVCPIGQDDQKLLLFDDFLCIDEGEIIGNVSKQAISRMRKVN